METVIAMLVHIISKLSIYFIYLEGSVKTYLKVGWEVRTGLMWLLIGAVGEPLCVR
jgi:hypothetical protein